MLEVKTLLLEIIRKKENGSSVSYIIQMRERDTAVLRHVTLKRTKRDVRRGDVFCGMGWGGGGGAIGVALKM